MLKKQDLFRINILTLLLVTMVFILIVTVYYINILPFATNDITREIFSYCIIIISLEPVFLLLEYKIYASSVNRKVVRKYLISNIIFSLLIAFLYFSNLSSTGLNQNNFMPLYLVLGIALFISSAFLLKKLEHIKSNTI